ncbi:MAG TPA: GNAT family N-acetyltransferase [Casimicrobiaceae bacterium]|nr:GNAT family N-acetyltransferase [Casimicrobiaceae bacterium]
MNPSVEWQWKPFAELAPAELYAALAARAGVFVVEQRCVFQDADGFDAHAWHLLGWIGSARERTLGAYLRLIEPGRRYREPSIGRVLTIASQRGTGLGRAAMLEGLARSAELYPGLSVRIAAQQRLERFYATMGFRPASAPYEEDGILHVDMLRDPQARDGLRDAGSPNLR